ncbi:MAG: prepilin-type N-terminal cleavage/methylation domain-containing protein [Alphaproteobacteria bacterium]|nr:prepilin-type N-terminal cleavage/methylation domain-containing protein [Alphaproteobacteria bacterium]
MRAEPSGFTLVEVLVALVLTALAGAAVMQLLGASIRGQDRAERLTLATLVAESKMAEVGASISLRPGTLQGSDTGIDWEVRVAPYAGLPPERLSALPVRAFAVEVVTRWANGRDDRVVLRTIRLGPRGDE